MVLSVIWKPTWGFHHERATHAERFSTYFSAGLLPLFYLFQIFVHPKCLKSAMNFSAHRAEARLRSPFLVVVPPQDRRAIADIKLLKLPTELIQFEDRRVQAVQTELQAVLRLYSSPRQPFCWSWCTQRELDFHGDESLVAITVKLFHHAVWSTRSQDIHDCAMWLLAVYNTYTKCLRPDIFNTFINNLKQAFPLVEDSNTDLNATASAKRVLLEHCDYLQYCAPQRFFFYDYLGDYAARSRKIDEAKAMFRQFEQVVRTMQEMSQQFIGKRPRPIATTATPATGTTSDAENNSDVDSLPCERVQRGA